MHLDTCPPGAWGLGPFVQFEIVADTEAKPDRASQEAIQRLRQDVARVPRASEEMSDWLYKGRVRAHGIAILLPKAYEPSTQGDTRPITLSTTFMKVVSQLLLGRAGTS